MNWKKKLGSLVPGEARAQLQNVLTVEWSGRKTVLVEVPKGQRESDVELSPFGDEHAQYGRLIDDDEETDADAFVRPRLGRGSSSNLGLADGRHESSTTERPKAERPRSAPNPWENPFIHEDDFSDFSEPQQRKAPVPPPRPRPTLVPVHADIWETESVKSPTSSTGSAAGAIQKKAYC